MVTPAKGEYRRIPVSPAGVPIINAWDPVADTRAGNQCKSYGAAAIMNVPGRLHITWQDADTLRVDTDAGTQTRLFRFTARTSSSTAKPTWQGESAARWEQVPAPEKGGSLRVVTSNMRSGYLRKNGVPYSERATVSEHFDVTSLPDGRRASPGHHRRRGSCLPERAIRHESSFQERTRRFQVGSHTMLIDLVVRRSVAALILVLVARVAFAQTDAAGPQADPPYEFGGASK